uniref:Sleeping Beauty transposase HTH domain-containing protein n=1 Tax=Stegastes partitus TaxID=144197 RepID=A0A3B5AN94_9TELE
MAPHGKELPQECKNLIVRLHRDGKGYKKIGDQLKISRNTVAAVIRRYRMNHSTTNQSRSGRPKTMPLHYTNPGYRAKITKVSKE